MSSAALHAERRALADRYCGADVTLNGARAIVCGRLQDFATIAVLPHGLRAEYAWQTVAHIIETRGGRFDA